MSVIKGMIHFRAVDETWVRKSSQNWTWEVVDGRKIVGNWCHAICGATPWAADTRLPRMGRSIKAVTCPDCLVWFDLWLELMPRKKRLTRRRWAEFRQIHAVKRTPRKEAAAAEDNSLAGNPKFTTEEGDLTLVIHKGGEK